MSEHTETEANAEASKSAVEPVVMRRVVCAACLSKCGKYMVTGPRHWCPTMRTQAGLMNCEGGIKWTGGEQGFVDQRGNFMTREEAWKVAQAAGQILRRVGSDTLNGGHLFSENLY